MTELDIVKYIRRREGDGKYTDHPDDRGGPTYTGITLRTYNRWRHEQSLPELTAREYKAMTENDKATLDGHVDLIYATKYIRPWTWCPDPLRFLCASVTVLSGQRRATKLLQRALGVDDDGIVGPATKRAVTNKDPLELAVEFCWKRQLHYARIVQKDGTQTRWIGGWTNGTFKDLKHAIAHMAHDMVQGG